MTAPVLSSSPAVCKDSCNLVNQQSKQKSSKATHQPSKIPSDIATAPIGVFDSGVGGLSVLTHLVHELPHEQFIYLADTLYVPYGSRQAADIQNLTLQAADWLVAQGCKLIVIACNTASAHGLEAVRARYPQLLVVGLVPALKPAVLRTQTRQVAVLATPATLHGELLNNVIEQIALPKGVTVHKYSFVSLVPWVEAGMPSSHLAVKELNELLKTLVTDHIDYLVLGCTHYPFFKGYLQDKIDSMMAADSQLTLIDSGQAIAKRVASLLHQHRCQNPQSKLPALAFFTTANLVMTQQVAERLLQQFLPHMPVEFHETNLLK